MVHIWVKCKFIVVVRHFYAISFEKVTFLICRYTDAATFLLRWGLAADKCSATNSQCKVKKFCFGVIFFIAINYVSNDFLPLISMVMCEPSTTTQPPAVVFLSNYILLVLPLKFLLYNELLIDAFNWSMMWLNLFANFSLEHLCSQPSNSVAISSGM